MGSAIQDIHGGCVVCVCCVACLVEAVLRRCAQDVLALIATLAAREQRGLIGTLVGLLGAEDGTAALAAKAFWPICNHKNHVHGAGAKQTAVQNAVRKAGGIAPLVDRSCCRRVAVQYV